jgi:ankyrin repeat protein
MINYSTFHDLFVRALDALDAPGLSALIEAHPEKSREIGAKFSPHCALTLGRVRHPDAESRRLHGAAWIDTAEVLMSFGFEPGADATQAWRRALTSSILDPAPLRWLFDRGLLASADWRRDSPQWLGAHGLEGLIELIRADGPSERELLRMMIQSGIAGGAEQSISATDCAVAGAWNCGQDLVDQGFGLGPCSTGPEQLKGADPLTALAGSFAWRRTLRQRAASSLAENEAEADEMSAQLDRFMGWGATFGADQARALSNPLAALLGDGDANRTASLPMLEKVGSKLVALGADPNAGALVLRIGVGFFLAEKEINRPHRAKATWDWALSVGARPSHAPELLLSATSRALAEKNASAMVDFLAAQGADPASCSRLVRPSPVEAALGRGFHQLAWKLGSMGAALDYVDEQGEGPLHHLAAQRGASENLLLGQLLSRPEILATIESPSASPRRAGETPLHRACGAQAPGPLKLLLERGANPNAQDAKGQTPMRHLLRKYGSRAQRQLDPQLRLLLAHGADPALADAKGVTPAQAACANAPLPALERLLALRPEDLVDERDSAKAAKAALIARGAEGGSLAFRVELGVEVPTARPRKKARGL